MSTEMWDRRYAAEGFAYGTEPNAFLASVADRIPPGPVLCIGAGEGRNAVFLAGRGHPVEAVDASSVGLAKARARARELGLEVTTTVADLADYEFGRERWAGIVSVFCHLPPTLRRDVHRRVVAALRPGGYFVLEAYTPAQLGRGTGGPRVRELLYDAETLRQDLAGLECIHLEEVEREVHEGRHHTGTAAVVQLVAVKRGA